MTVPENNQVQLPVYPAAVILDGLKVLFLGLVFALFAGAILWVNEWNNLTRIKNQLQEETAIVELDPKWIVNSDYEGKLIHLTGALKTTEPILEDWLNIKIEGIRLFRRVQVYEETDEKVITQEQSEPSTLHSGRWIDKTAVEVPAVNSSIPAQIVRTNNWCTEHGLLGEHPISPSLLERLTHFQQLNFSQHINLEQFNTSDKSDVLPQSNSKTSPTLPMRWEKLTQGLMWGNSQRPSQSGDIRVLYYYVPTNLTVSVIARQGTEGRLEPFITNAGEVIERLQLGEVDWKALYPEGKPPLNWLLWTFRVLGSLLMWAGCWFLILPGTRIIRQLEIRNLNFNFEPMRMSALAAVLLSLLVISAAWLYYQPLWGTLFILSLLLLLGGTGYYFWRKFKSIKRIGDQS
ncbi:MAG: hypothetical protein KDA65_07115 [Planctomycetaceae bacterium]|nr:hypothetical protein [Planctomycetaceae bacterium]